MKIEIRKEYYDNKKTKIARIIYHKKGERGFYHREDGPAFQRFYENGQLGFEGYCINGQWHREDGPARIWYHPDGSIDHQQFWLNNEVLTEKEFKMKQRLKGTLLENKY